MAIAYVPVSARDSRRGRTRVFARVPVPPRTSTLRAPQQPGTATGVLPGCPMPWHCIMPSSGAMAVPRLPGWHCAGACGKRNLGSAQFPSWPNVMHKGRAVPAAADAPSLPEPPAHDQPFGAGIFHSIPRQSDMLQCPGTLAAVTASAADTPEQQCVAWPAQSHRENLLQTALEEPS